MSASQKESIVFVDEKAAICGLNNDQRIYSITAAHLLSCIKNNKSSIVYFWSPNCHGKACISLKAAEDYCSKNNYRLYIITDYYDLEKIKVQNIATIPILSVNHQHYKTDYCNKYMRLFTNELVHNRKLNPADNSNRFFVFKGDSLVGTREELFNEQPGI